MECDEFDEFECTVEAPVNIALVKYWGKRDQELILPFNDSVSLSLDESVLGTRTTVKFSASYEFDELILNGTATPISNRLANVIDEIRRSYRKIAIKKKLPTTELMGKSRYKFRIESENKMPTAAGLASSASGMACITFGLCTALNITDDIDLSRLARLGSGSACRSVYGGLVQWIAGQEEDGSDSIAKQLHPADHWPELRFIVLVVNGEKKKIGSTDGMQRSIITSDFMKSRPQQCRDRIQELAWAYQAKQFSAMAEIIMKDSNTLHAICRDTFPPVSYLNVTSNALIDFVHDFNTLQGETSVAYTFDAGPNCFLLMKEEIQSLVLNLLKSTFLKDNSDVNIYCDDMKSKFSPLLSEYSKYSGSVETFFLSKVGNGPSVVTPVKQI